MIALIRMMATCRWSAHRIQRYIDADPAAVLTSNERRRLEDHLAVCERCTAAVNQSRGVKAALARFGDRRVPDSVVVARLRLQARQFSRGDVV